MGCGFWLAVSHLNPFFYLIDGFRYGFTGHAEGDLLLGGAMSLAITLALLGGMLSIGSFMALTVWVGQPNESLQTVFRVDIAALVLLLAAGAAHLRTSAR